MRILQIVFFLSVCGCPQALSLAISDILEIVKLSKDVVIDVVKTLKLLDKYVWQSSKVNGQRVLFEKIKIVNNKIDMFSAQMGIGSQVLNAMVEYTGIQFKLKLKLREVIKNIDLIKLKYKDMGTFIESKTAYEALSLVEFARSAVSPSKTSAQRLLDRIHNIIAPEKDDHYDEDEDYGADRVPSVFKILNEIIRVQGNKMFCNMQSSEQQLVLNLYNTLALTELKGFLIMEFSYMLLKLHSQGYFQGEIEVAQERYKDRSVITLKLTIEALKWVPYELWKCDPDKHVKNETYIEITGFLQGYIEHEVDLNHERSCDAVRCGFNETKSYECYYTNQDMLCNMQRQCKGTIIDCQIISDGTVCHAEMGTNRRYEYIEQAGKVLGRKKECAHYSTSFKEWILVLPIRCEYCMCFCDEQGVNSDRYFSMHSIESKIDHNMVVTGLRFVKKSRNIHLQIQQGKLLPNAQIDVATVHWKPVEDYSINSRRVRDGEDYHTLTWKKRSFDLDELVTEEEEVVTGVRFRMIGSHLNFQIRMTPFNFTTGTLEVGKSKWKHNEISQNDREKLNLDNKDIPIRDPGRSLPVSKSGMYLEFTHSDLDMDVAQTTVPFIDAQAVALAQPAPLSGAGVMYKGSKNFGGFIYPMIRTYDYLKPLLNADDDTNFGKKFLNKK